MGGGGGGGAREGQDRKETFSESKKSFKEGEQLLGVGDTGHNNIRETVMGAAVFEGGFSTASPVTSVT